MNVSVIDTDNISATIHGNNLTILPSSNWNGTEILTFMVSDGKTEMKFEYTVIVEGINDPPQNLGIDFAEAVLKKNGNQFVSASFFDPDIGDEANITWYVDGKIFSHAISVNLSLPAGRYDLTLRVTDKSGNYTEITLPIKIEKKANEPVPSEPDLTWILILAVVKITLALLVTSLFIFGRKDRDIMEIPEGITPVQKSDRRPILDEPGLITVKERNTFDVKNDVLRGNPMPQVRGWGQDETQDLDDQRKSSPRMYNSFILFPILISN